MLSTPPIPPPRVCFVLVAYNQAQWVRQACEAALNQDYSPLEIIFSDDASTDDTFEIMSTIVQAYSGPHHVRLNRNAKNLGLINHINRLQTLANADLLIGAAGDDISLPHRTRRLVEAFQQSGGQAYSFHSSVNIIDGGGEASRIWRPPLTDNHPDPTVWMTSMATLIGATQAWARPLFDRFGPITETLAYEDLVLAYRAMLLGGLRYLDEPLVHYRENIGLSTQHIRQLTPLKAKIRKLSVRLAVLNQRRRDCLKVGRRSLARSLGIRVLALWCRLIVLRTRIRLSGDRVG